MQTMKELRVVLSLIFICCGLLLPAKTIGQNEPASYNFQIQQSLNQLLGEQDARHYQKIISPEELINWEVYMPDNDSTELPGVVVYISPQKSGRIDPRWRSVMNQQNLIYIAANDSGNRVPVNRRMILATMAIKALAQQHVFDSDHIIVAGFSGGGRVASVLASQYPETFTGFLYICGVDFWQKKQAPKVDRLVQNRFVFLTGSRDFNRSESSRIYRRYVKAGAKHSKLMVIPSMSHERPDAKALTEALAYLSGQDQT
jgi:dienelactone hydrolase